MTTDEKRMELLATIIAERLYQHIVDKFATRLILKRYGKPLIKAKEIYDELPEPRFSNPLQICSQITDEIHVGRNFKTYYKQLY